MSVDEVADELYGRLPAEFVGARAERSRELRSGGDRDGARLVAALRKPTVAGWLVNAVVRHHRDQVDELLALGEELGRAQRSMDGPALRSLAGRRQALLAGLGRGAEALAHRLGNPVSPAVMEEVVATFGAALADPEAAAQVRRGRLTGALSYAGLGGLGTAPLRAVPPATPSAQPAPGPRTAPPQAPPPAVPSPDPDRDADREPDPETEDDRSRAARQARERAAVAQAGQRVRQADEQARQAAERHELAVQQEARAQHAVDDAKSGLARATEALHEARRSRQEALAAARLAGQAQRAAVAHQLAVEAGQPASDPLL